MSLAETALAESTETLAVDSPYPNTYWVGPEATGTPQVPPNSEIEIYPEHPEDPETKYFMRVAGVSRGPIEPVGNGDFFVVYQDGIINVRLQFRQSGDDAGRYLYGFAIPEKLLAGNGVPKAMDDPPITGVWGAETRPPNDDYAV